jgi:phosphatidate cytidylyltransferase
MALSNLTTRILVALVGIPLMVAATLIGGYFFAGLVAIIALAGLLELYNLARAKGASPQTIIGVIFSLCLLAVFMYDKLHLVIIGMFAAYGVAIPFPTMAQEFLIAVLIFLPLILGVELFRNKPGALVNIATTILGPLYVAFALGSLIGIRELFVPADFPVYGFFALPPGPTVPEEVSAQIYRWGGFTVLGIFVAIWMCDSGAYFAGRAFGRHKLFPRVSPNKTWEGAIAGFLAAVLAFVLFRQFLLPYLSLRDALVCGGIIGIFGQIGDLVESLLKRDAGVKDSSTLIPGHGGVLDRFDSLLFVAPLLFCFLDFVVF